MADNKKPEPGFGKPADIDPDDPFAELARLIAPAGEAPRRDPSPVETPETDDELLRGFDLDMPAEPSEPEAAPEPVVLEQPPEPYYEFVSFEAVPAYREPDPLPEDDRFAEQVPEETETPPAAFPADDFGNDALAVELERSIGTFEFEAPEAEQQAAAEEQVVEAPLSFELPTGLPEYEFHQAYDGGRDPDLSEGPEPVEPVAEQEPEGAPSEAPSSGVAQWEADAQNQEVPPSGQGEDELALDLDELEMELFELDLDADEAVAEPGPEPLEEAGAREAGFEDAFDPAALIDTDEPPAPVDELDLPRMADDGADAPQAEPYEFDLDEELADAMASHPATVDPLYESQPDVVSEEKSSDQPPVYAAASAYSTNIEDTLDDDFRQIADDVDYRQPYHPDDNEQDRQSALFAGSFLNVGRLALFSLIGVFLVVALVFAGMRFFSGDGESGPVVITADNSSVKEAPEDPGGEVVPNQDNAVFNDVNRTLAETPRQDSLIASDEEPANVDEVAPNPIADTADSGAVETQPETSAAAIAPRRVRTIIVKPDGTLVERVTDAPANNTDTASSSGARGIETVTALPDQNGRLVVSSAQNATTGQQAGETGVEPANSANSVADVLQNNQPAGESGAVAGSTAQDAAGDTPALTAAETGIANPPLPTPRPARPANPRPVAVASAASAASSQSASAPAAAATTTQTGSPYAMQIASLPSEQEARAAYRRLSAQHPAVLGRQQVEFVPATIAGKGTYYRVRIVAGSLSDAIALCERYKADGGSCYVPR